MMLLLLAYTSAFGLGALSLGANVLYALDIGSDYYSRALWVLVAVCSALWTACGMAVVWRQGRAGEYARCFGALLLLLLAVTFDALAAYDLSRRELAQASERARQDASARSDIERDMQLLRDQVSIAAPALDVARAALVAAASRVSDTDCSITVGRMHLDRVRTACQSLTTARADLAAATSRAEAAARLETLRARLAALGPLNASQARASLFPPEIVAWVPVLLILIGSLFGPWSLEPAKPRGRTDKDVAQATKFDRVRGARGSSVVVALQSISATPPTPECAVDSSGWIRAPQRVLAGAADMSLSGFNRALKAAESRGEVEIRKSGKQTAIRLGQSARIYN